MPHEALVSPLVAAAVYAVYLIISIVMTIWVARALSRNGEVFLVKCFGQDSDLARSTNQLLVIGFYLVNIAFICMRLEGWRMDPDMLIPEVGSRVGFAILVLGFMHFFNMIMLSRFGRILRSWMRESQDDRMPPLPR